MRSTFLVLTFPFALAFMATLVLALILAFVAPFGGRIFTFLGYNGEKRGIRSWGGTPLELLDGPLLVPVLTCRGGLPFTGPLALLYVFENVFMMYDIML